VEKPFFTYISRADARRVCREHKCTLAIAATQGPIVLKESLFGGNAYETFHPEVTNYLQSGTMSLGLTKELRWAIMSA
jgi:hypothetical protein